MVSTRVGAGPRARSPAREDPLGELLESQGWRRVGGGGGRALEGAEVVGVWVDRADRCLFESRYGERGAIPTLHTLLSDGTVVTTSVARGARALAAQEWSGRYYLELPERDPWSALTTHRARVMEVCSARRCRPVAHGESGVHRALVDHLERVTTARARFLDVVLLLGLIVGLPGLLALIWVQAPLVRVDAFFGTLAMLGGPAAWASVFGLTLAWLYQRMPDPGPMPRELLLAELGRPAGDGPVSRRVAEAEARALWPGVLATLGSQAGVGALLIGATLLAT